VLSGRDGKLGYGGRLTQPVRGSCCEINGYFSLYACPQIFKARLFYLCDEIGLIIDISLFLFKNKIFKFKKIIQDLPCQQIIV
jgi:hypothetical protein